MQQIDVRRLATHESTKARELFRVMGKVFEETGPISGEAYAAQLLARDSFWAFAAFVDGAVVGGLTAHVLPLTRRGEQELFIYDIAILPRYQRRGLGARLMEVALATAAASGIAEVFVAADNEDEHALEFYRAMGGESSAVTVFTFPAR